MKTRFRSRIAAVISMILVLQSAVPVGAADLIVDDGGSVVVSDVLDASEGTDMLTEDFEDAVISDAESEPALETADVLTENDTEAAPEVIDRDQDGGELHTDDLEEVDSPITAAAVSRIKKRSAELKLSFNDVGIESVSVAAIAGEIEDGTKVDTLSFDKVVDENGNAYIKDLEPGTGYKLFATFATLSGDTPVWHKVKDPVATLDTVKEYSISFLDDNGTEHKKIEGYRFRSVLSMNEEMRGVKPVLFIDNGKESFAYTDDKAKAYAVGGSKKVETDLENALYTVFFNSDGDYKPLVADIKGSDALYSKIVSHENEVLLANYNAFKASCEEGSVEGKTLSANTSIRIEGENAGCSGTISLELADMEAVVSADALTLYRTTMSENDKLSCHIFGDGVDDGSGYDLSRGLYEIPCDSYAASAFRTDMNIDSSSGLVSINNTYKKGNGKIWIEDYKPLKEDKEHSTWPQYDDFTGVKLVAEGKELGTDMTVMDISADKLTADVKKPNIGYDELSSLANEPVDVPRFENYFTLKVGETVIPSHMYVDYAYAVSSNGPWDEERETIKNLKAGDTLYISANVIQYDTSWNVVNTIWLQEPIALTIDKEIITLNMDGVFAAIAGQDLAEFAEMTTADLVKDSDWAVGCLTLTAAKDKDGKQVELEGDMKSAVNLSDWLKKPILSVDQASKADIAKINNEIPGVYNIYFETSDEDLISENNINVNYSLAGKPVARLIVEDGVIVGFYRADTGEQVSGNQAFLRDELAGGKDVTISVPVSKVKDPFVKWKAANNLDNGLVADFDGVSSNKTGGDYEYTFDFTGYFRDILSANIPAVKIKRIRLYGDYSELARKTGKKDTDKASTGTSVSVGTIMPVVYTGNKLYVTDDTKAYSKGSVKKGIDPVIELKIWNSDTGAKLTCGTDYTLSYKNNVNAANSSSKKVPTITIKGKGNYKGFTYTVPFTILPADLDSMAMVKCGKSRYVKYGKKGFDSKYTVVLKSNNKKKLAKKTYDLVYYDENGIPVDATKYTTAITDRFTKFFVTAKAKPDKSGNSNYTGETTFNVDDQFDGSIVYGIPSKSKALKVKLSSKNKVEFEEGKKPGELFTIKEVTDSKKKVLPAEDYTVHFLNLNMDEDITDKPVEVGVYYCSVELNDPEKMKELGIYQATLVKVTVKGRKLTGGKLDKKSITYSTGENLIKISLSGKANDPKYVEWNLDGDEWKKLNETDTFDAKGLSVGKHTVNLRGTGAYESTKKLTLTVKAEKINNYTEGVNVVINNGEQVPLNLAGYYSRLAEGAKVTVHGEKLKLYDDYTLTFSNSKKADTEETMTIKFVNSYSGSYKQKFKVRKGNVGTADNVTLKVVSVLSTDQAPKVELYQEDWFPEVKKNSNGVGYYVASWKSKKATLKSGRDYTLETGSTGNLSNGVKYIDGTVTGSGVFEGTSSVRSYAYGPNKKIKGVVVTKITGGNYTDEPDEKHTESKGSAEAVTVNGKLYAKFMGDLNGNGSNARIEPAVSEVKVTYTDKSTAVIKGSEIYTCFDVDYSNNRNISKKAEIILTPKNIKGLIGGPSSWTYSTRFEITGELPKSK